MNNTKTTKNKKEKVVTKKTKNTIINLKNISKKQYSIDEWINNLYSLKLDDEHLNMPNIRFLIEYNYLYLKNNLDFYKFIKNNYKELIDSNNKKIIKREQKQFNKELLDFLLMIDEIVHNIEFNWNQNQFFEDEFNVINVNQKKIKKNKSKTLLIDKSLEYNYNNLENIEYSLWNYEIIFHLKSDETFKTKNYIQHLNSLSYFEIYKLLNTKINQIISCNNFINAMSKLWKILSTQKIKFISEDITLFELVDSLSYNSNSVKEIIRSLPNKLNTYSNMTNIEFLKIIPLKSIKYSFLDELNNEIIYYKKILDVLMEKYFIEQDIIEKKLEQKIQDELINDSLNSNKIKTILDEFPLFITNITESEFIELLSNYQNKDDFRNKLKFSINNFKEVSIHNDKSKTINTYFQKINIEFGILYDLYSFVILIISQYRQQKKILKKTHDINYFLKLHILQLKEKYACNIIYNFMLIHLSQITKKQSYIQILLSQSTKKWLVRYKKGFEFRQNNKTNNK